MMETLDLTNAFDKVEALKTYLYGLRDRCGGMAMFLIIPPTFQSLMYNMKVEESLDDSNDFYNLGWYDSFRISIYVDKTLIDTMYFFGNTKGVKTKVINGQ